MTASDRRRPQLPGLLTTMLGLALIRVGLLVIGYPRTRRFAERVTGARVPVPAPASAGGWHREFGSQVAEQIVRAAVFFPGRAICLEQSLTLYALLRRSGIAADLRLAVQPIPFTAHAWVEVDGAPVNETEERIRHFHPLQAGS